MAIEDFAAEPATAATVRTQVRFSRPLRYVVRAVLFLVLIGFLGFILQAGLVQAFMTNPGLNGLILGALLVGCLIALRELWRIHSEARAATNLAVAPASADIRRGQVIAPLGSVLPALEHGTLAPAQAVTALESIAVRLDDGREVLRYLSGLLVFLGLLGTFWGLLDTVGSVGTVIKSLRTGAEAGVLFDELKAGLSAPLAGMGLSFSSSLFGIAGSLILGFLDLQVGRHSAASATRSRAGSEAAPARPMRLPPCLRPAIRSPTVSSSSAPPWPTAPPTIAPRRRRSPIWPRASKDSSSTCAPSSR